MARYSAVIVTSANALRGIEPHLKGHGCSNCRCSRWGSIPAKAARRAGFYPTWCRQMATLQTCGDLVLASLRAKELKKASTLLYLAGAEIARDLASELEERRFRVVCSDERTR